MDREYAFRFSYKRTILSIDERTAFAEMFTRMVRVASLHREFITRAVDRTGKNTSPAKVVDDAIVGYMIDREKMEAPGNAPDPAATADP